MALLLEMLLLAASVLVLSTSSHIVLRSSLHLSELFGIRKFSIGFILIAVATSLPEFAVSVLSSLRGEGGIVLGNVIGSNIVTILAVLGLSALIGGMKLKAGELENAADALFLMTIVPLFLLMLAGIGFLSGVVLLLVFAIYVYHSLASSGEKHARRAAKDGARLKVAAAFVFGMAFLLAGADFTVSSAVNIASALNIAPSIIGLTIIAFGTSLPELVVAINALLGGHSELALGDIVGTCVVNITAVLAVGALISELTISKIVFQSSTVFLVGVSVLLTYVLLKYRGIPKRVGLAFLLLYIVFIMSEIGLISVL